MNLFIPSSNKNPRPPQLYTRHVVSMVVTERDAYRMPALFTTSFYQSPPRVRRTPKSSTEILPGLSAYLMEKSSSLATSGK